MNVPTGTLKSTRTVHNIVVTDGPVLPVAHSVVAGKKFRVERLEIDIYARADGERRVYITQHGIVLKKDGTDSLNRNDERLSGFRRGSRWDDHWFTDLATSLGIDLTERTS